MTLKYSTLAMTGGRQEWSVVIVRYDFSEIQFEEGQVYQASAVPPVTLQTWSVNTGQIRNNALASCETQYGPGFVRVTGSIFR